MMCITTTTKGLLHHDHRAGVHGRSAKGSGCKDARKGQPGYDRLFLSKGWNQWTAKMTGCKTTACLAGNVLSVTQCIPDPPQVLAVSKQGQKDLGTTVPAAAAAVLFGLGDDPQGYDELFLGSRTLGELWSMAEELTGGYVELPKPLKKTVKEIDAAKVRNGRG